MDEPTPTITLPLRAFLDILWGYKKGAELRERAVPGQEIVTILRSIPGYEKFYHIQDPKSEDSPDSLSTVWQLEYWRASGERQEIRKKENDVLYGGIDAMVDALLPKFPMLNREALRVFADGLVFNKQWPILQGYGIDTTELEKVVK